MNTNELKPCPFCGGKAEFEQFGTARQSTIVACTQCGCRLESGETKRHGWPWNTRHAPANNPQASVQPAVDLGIVMKSEYVELLAQKQVKATEDLILMAMPDKATLSSITAMQYGHGGKTVYCYDGVPFLEIWPPTFESVHEDNAYKIKATQEYRIIK